MKITYTEEMVNTYPPGYEGWKFYRVEFSNGKSGAIWCSPELGHPIDVKVKAKVQKKPELPLMIFPEGAFTLTDD